MAIASKYQLAAIAKKYQFLTGWWKQMSATDIVDFMRERTLIKPLEIQLPAAARSTPVYRFYRWL